MPIELQLPNANANYLILIINFIYRMFGGEDWAVDDVLQIGNDYLCILIFSKLINKLNGYLFVTPFACNTVCSDISIFSD